MTTIPSWPRPAVAQIEPTPRAIDFGERGHEERPAETLVLRNVGNADATIQAIRPSCSCIHVEPAEARVPIPPGGTLELVVSMSSGRALGNLEKYIAIETKPAAMRIPVRMRVLPGVDVEPRDLRFDGIFGGSPIVQSVEIVLRAPAGNEVEVRSEGVRNPAQPARRDPHFECAVRDLEEGTESSADELDAPGARSRRGGARAGKRIDVTLKPTHPEGRIQAQLYARVGGRLLVVPISGEMFRWIKVVPTYFNFSRISKEDPSSTVERAELESTDGREFRILSMEPRFNVLRPEGTQLRLEIDGGEDGKPAVRHVIRATIVPPDRPGIPALKDGTLGSFSGEVTVRTDHPEKPTVTLRVFGFIAASKG